MSLEWPFCFCSFILGQLHKISVLAVMKLKEPSTNLSISSVQFSHSAESNSLLPHELQDARPPCPSPTPGVHPNPSLLSWWCHPAISSSVYPSSPALHLSQHQGLFKVELFQILKDDAVKLLHSICQQIWKTQQWPQDWKRSVFISIRRWSLWQLLCLKGKGCFVIYIFVS